MNTNIISNKTHSTYKKITTGVLGLVALVGVTACNPKTESSSEILPMEYTCRQGENNIDELRGLYNGGRQDIRYFNVKPGHEKNINLHDLGVLVKKSGFPSDILSISTRNDYALDGNRKHVDASIIDEYGKLQFGVNTLSYNCGKIIRQYSADIELQTQ